MISTSMAVDMPVQPEGALCIHEHPPSCVNWEALQVRDESILTCAVFELVQVKQMREEAMDAYQHAGLCSPPFI